jgi:hypothetical protein
MRHSGLAVVIIAAMLLAASFPAPVAQTPIVDAGEAGDAIGANIEVERTLLAEDLDAHARIAVERERVLALLLDLHAALDTALRSETPEAVSTVEDLVTRLDRAERERADQLARERLLVDRIHERMRRIQLLEEQLLLLQGRHHATRGALEGMWTVTLMPNNQRGVFRFEQTGAMVTGTYELAGGFTGSLQGTLVDRKVRVVRIDSKLGRYMELEGFISADGKRLRGSWLSYDHSGGTPPHGSWSATRGASGE